MIPSSSGASNEIPANEGVVIAGPIMSDIHAREHGEAITTPIESVTSIESDIMAATIDSVHQAAVIHANDDTKDEISAGCPIGVSVDGLTVASKEVPHSKSKLIRETSRGVAALMKQLQQNKGSDKATN
ncbi:hypothetical protein V6N13_033926 [Hibiscus sabdariffa]|uniref:Uncharacterized protein n=1 Tax=Hibiscus sabdariffa TaxID=183260 RepID=A0ABR2F946_9ROSI